MDAISLNLFVMVLFTSVVMLDLIAEGFPCASVVEIMEEIFPETGFVIMWTFGLGLYGLSYLKRANL